LAESVEAGLKIAFGVLDPRSLPVAAPADTGPARARALLAAWGGVGMAARTLTGSGITPSCGLAGVGAAALTALRICAAAADRLAESVEEDR
jgi:hypothetical protein